MRGLSKSPKTPPSTMPKKVFFNLNFLIWIDQHEEGTIHKRERTDPGSQVARGVGISEK